MEGSLRAGTYADPGGCVLLWRAAVAEVANSGDAYAAEDEVVGNNVTNTAAV